MQNVGNCQSATYGIAVTVVVLVCDLSTWANEFYGGDASGFSADGTAEKVYSILDLDCRCISYQFATNMLDNFR